MQVNCLVFPSPQKFNIDPIIVPDYHQPQDKIILIPQDIDNSTSSPTHIEYQHYMNLIAQNDNDEFQKFIRKVNSQSTYSRGDYSKTNNDNNISSVPVHKLAKRQEKIQKHQYNTLSTKHSQKQSLLPLTINNNCNYSFRQTNIMTDYKVPSEQFIPCLFLPGKKDKIVVFFHANAEDITSSSEFLKMINYQTMYPILAMEYRGYSVYSGQTKPEMINSDAHKVIKYLLKRNITPEQMIIFGRSIGCAIALGLVSSQYRFYSMVLLSPFLSLKKIAKQLYGDCAGWALKEGFDNEKNTLQISCPLLLIHGMKDTLVPYQHSLALFSHCKSYCQLKLIENMTHSRFNFKLDFIKHFQSFLHQLNQQHPSSY